MIGDCPKCGLACPPGTRYCDCGYDFETGRIELSHVQKNGANIFDSPYLLIISLASCLGGFTMELVFWITLVGFPYIGFAVGLLGLLILVAAFARNKS